MALSLPEASAPGWSSRTESSPTDQALSLFLCGEMDPALRWAAAILEGDPWAPSAILVTALLLGEVGQREPAVDGLKLAVHRAIDAGDIAIAIAAIDRLREIGAAVDTLLDDVATAFSRESTRLHPLPPLVRADSPDFRPLSPLLASSELVSKAVSVLLAAKHAGDEASSSPPAITPVPLFSDLGRQDLRDLLDTMRAEIAAPGHRVVQEGVASPAAYLVATGELELARHTTDAAGKRRSILGRVGVGRWVGEVAFLSGLAEPATVRASSASILLVLPREPIGALAASRPALREALEAGFREHALANLGFEWALGSLLAPEDCASLVSRLQAKVFQKGDRLLGLGEEPQGMHLIVSGEVAIVARDGGPRVILSSREPGDTVGEESLVLCQRSNVEATAATPATTLLLSREVFLAIAVESPQLLQSLYAIAVRRHVQTRSALAAGAAAIAEPHVAPSDKVAAEILALDVGKGASLPALRGAPQKPTLLGLGLGLSAAATATPAGPPVAPSSAPKGAPPVLSSAPKAVPVVSSLPPARPAHNSSILPVGAATSIPAAPAKTAWPRSRSAAIVAAAAGLVAIPVLLLTARPRSQAAQDESDVRSHAQPLEETAMAATARSSAPSPSGSAAPAPSVLVVAPTIETAVAASTKRASPARAASEPKAQTPAVAQATTPSVAPSPSVTPAPSSSAASPAASSSGAATHSPIADESPAHVAPSASQVASAPAAAAAPTAAGVAPDPSARQANPIADEFWR